MDEVGTIGDGINILPSQLEGAGLGAYTDRFFPAGSVVTLYTAAYVGAGKADVANLPTTTHVVCGVEIRFRCNY